MKIDTLDEDEWVMASFFDLNQSCIGMMGNEKRFKCERI